MPRQILCLKKCSPLWFCQYLIKPSISQPCLYFSRQMRERSKEGVTSGRVQSAAMLWAGLKCVHEGFSRVFWVLQFRVGAFVDLPLCKKPLLLLPSAEGVMKDSVCHTEEWNRKTPEPRARAGGSLSRMLPTSFCLKIVMLGHLKACECLARVLYPLQELLPH